MGKIITKIEYIPMTNIKEEYSAVYLDDKIIGIANDSIKSTTDKNYLPIGHFEFIYSSGSSDIVGMIMKHNNYSKMPNSSPLHLAKIESIENTERRGKYEY